MTQKQNEKVLARTLYFETNQSQSQIAETLNINPKTLYLWMQEGEWQRLKKAARQVPALIVDSLCEQLTELNNSILGRPPGNRFPTREEAEISRKLVLSIDKVKKQATLSDNIQVMKSFTSYLYDINPDLAKQVTLIADDFLKTKAQDGSHPYEMDYGSDNDIKKEAQPEVVISSLSRDGMPSNPQDEETVTQSAATETEEEQQQQDTEQEEQFVPSMQYREGFEEIYNPNLSPLYTKEVKVGKITIRFGRMISPGTHYHIGS